ncbi:MAG TPA: helix-turn-helix domain-containing protein [Pseudonocardia sp.]|jgi:AcrR family transcriptional regulator
MARAKPPEERLRLTTQARRELILEAARSVFVQHGYSGSRTKMIAQAAGVSEALVFSHFDSKDALFEAAILEPLQVMVGGLVAEAQRLPELSGQGRREASVQINTAVLTAMKEIAPLLGVALYSEASFAKRFYREKLKPLLDQIRSSIAASMQGWPHQTVDPAVLTAVLLGTYNWMILESNLDWGQGALDVQHVASELTNLLVRSFNAPPG